MNLKGRVSRLEARIGPQADRCRHCGGSGPAVSGLVFLDGDGQDLTKRCDRCGRSVQFGGAAHGEPVKMYVGIEPDAV